MSACVVGCFGFGLVSSRCLVTSGVLLSFGVAVSEQPRSRFGFDLVLCWFRVGFFLVALWFRG